MTIFQLFAITILLLVLALCAYILYKIRRVHLMQYSLQQQFEHFPETLNLTYRQIQAFISLEGMLGLPYALPPLRSWAASPDFLLVLAEYSRQQLPEVIVECSSGASTIVLAQCAKMNRKGHIFSLEHDPIYAEKTRQELKKQDLLDWATVIDAPLQDYNFDDQNYLWYTINEQIQSTQIDMLIIDGPPAGLNHCARYPVGPLLFPLLNKKSAVFLDDANRIDEQKIISTWLNDFPEMSLSKYDCEKGAVCLIN